MLLITPEQVIQHAFAPREQITPSSIRPLKIDVAQEHFIRPRLGDELFEQLTQGAYADFTEDYIAPALAHFVRYGVLGELCVEVGDRGALVYSASSDLTKTARNQESTANQTKDQTKSTVADTTANNLNTIHDTTNTNAEGSGQTTTSDVSNGAVVDRVEQTETYNSRITNGTQAEKIEEQRTTTHTAHESATNNAEHSADENRSASGERYRPATTAELRALAVRTLSDAQILLAKAVRYVERNPNQFAEYAPQGLAHNVFF